MPAFISKKIFRNRDFEAVKAKKHGFKRFFLKNNPETIYKTPRGWFYVNLSTKESGEISVADAQFYLDKWNIKYNTGW